MFHILYPMQRYRPIFYNLLLEFLGLQTTTKTFSGWQIKYKLAQYKKKSNYTSLDFLIRNGGKYHQNGTIFPHF